MIYTIHKITDNVVIGSVQDVDWIVVADIPRQMVKYNRVKPQNICLINDDSVDTYNQEFEEFWIIHLAKRLRNWILLYHEDKLFAYNNEIIGVSYEFRDI